MNCDLDSSVTISDGHSLGDGGLGNKEVNKHFVYSGKARANGQ